MNGILVVDKPKGITSHDVVDAVRRRFRIKKVGHAGTLDPLATGVLVLLVGAATKLSGRLMSEDKEYEVVMTLGRRTKTGDADGEVILENGDFSGVTPEKVKTALAKFSGEIYQTPPMTSAIKYQGKKLYELARKGIEIKREPRPVTIKGMDMLEFNPPDVRIRIKCSKGTYVRVLCDDVGLELGCGAYVSNIRRTRSGDFPINEAVEFEKLRTTTRKELGLLLKNADYYKFKTT
ncbi:MAG: tRNA pseudouridine(55) synthase TruB [Candidatus Omnitrophica bacterium]|nr:tRNA pseudouridine(55) synthase TruB [Candidatus Omnitrophota bacterium]